MRVSRHINIANILYWILENSNINIENLMDYFPGFDNPMSRP